MSGSAPVDFFRDFCKPGCVGVLEEDRFMMKTRVMAVAIGMFLVVGVGFADNIKKREKRQKDRVDQGIESGELTKKEAAKLRAQEAKLHREIKKDRRDGGGLTAKERVKIDAKQDRLSRRIAKQKHDKQKRKK